jgi:hypothetical protein
VVVYERKPPCPILFVHCSLRRASYLRSLSGRTREEYVRYVRKLASHSGKDPSVLEEAEARAYLPYLKEQKKFAPSSMRIAVAALQMFFKDVFGRDWKLFAIVRSPDCQKLRSC